MILYGTVHTHYSKTVLMKHYEFCMLLLHKNSQAVKKGAALKSLGQKSFEIKGGSQQMAACNDVNTNKF